MIKIIKFNSYKMKFKIKEKNFKIIKNRNNK